MVRLLLPLLLLLGACMKAPVPPAEGGAAGGTPKLSFTAPEDWTEQPITMAIFLGMWELPGGAYANVSWMPGQGNAASVAANSARDVLTRSRKSSVDILLLAAPIIRESSGICPDRYRRNNPGRILR